eukprot:13661223-Alexandrium_andersonii.AAC.1
MAAAIAMESSHGWRTEPLFFRPAGAASPIARLSLSTPPNVDQWIISLASVATVAAGMNAVGWKQGEGDLVGRALAEAM